MVVEILKVMQTHSWLKRISVSLTLAAAVLMVVKPSMAWAEDEVAVDGYLITFEEPNRPMTVDSAEGPSEIEFVISGDFEKEPAKAPFNIPDLVSLSESMRADSYTARLKNEIIVPVSTADAESVAALLNRPHDEVETFLAKKQMYLEKLAALLSRFKLRTSWINKALHSVNAQLFKNSSAVAHGDSIIVTPAISMSIGAGMNEAMVKQIRRAPFLRNVPMKSGFFYMGNMGLSLVFTKVDGKTKVSVQPTLMFRRATRIMSPFVMAAVGLIISGSVKSSRASELREKLSFNTLASATMFNNHGEIGMDLPIEIGLPPGGAAIAAFSGDQVRYRFTAENLMRFLETAYFKLRSHTVDRKCHALFARARLTS